MIEADKTAFSFEEFKVPQFSYKEVNHKGVNLRVGFEPSGSYFQETGIFEIQLKFIAYEEDAIENPIFDVISVSKFKFNTPIFFDEIPSYFYRNSIAIVFPYIRAFISTLTLHANTKLLKLGLMNLTGMEKALKENTVVV